MKSFATYTIDQAFVKEHNPEATIMFQTLQKLLRDYHGLAIELSQSETFGGMLITITCRDE